MSSSSSAKISSSNSSSTLLIRDSLLFIRNWARGLTHLFTSSEYALASLFSSASLRFDAWFSKHSFPVSIDDYFVDNSWPDLSKFILLSRHILPEYSKPLSKFDGLTVPTAWFDSYLLPDKLFYTSELALSPATLLSLGSLSPNVKPNFADLSLRKFIFLFSF